MSDHESADCRLLLWAKSDANGRPHSLLCHLYDAMAVAEIMWDQWFSPGFKTKLEAQLGTKARSFFIALVGLHDVGKATPAFQAKCPELAQQVHNSGLQIPSRPGDLAHWRASAAIVARSIAASQSATQTAPKAARGRSRRTVRALWFQSIIDGHHGKFSPQTTFDSHAFRPQGKGPWHDAQQSIVDEVLNHSHLTWADMPEEPPAQALQLMLAGFVSMADWIASGEHFPGLGFPEPDMELARSRATKAWNALGLVSGWEPPKTEFSVDFADRFSFQPRPFQKLWQQVATDLENSGLAIVEAPMGEGKTEFGLHLSEAIAHQMGCSGVGFAMPTQGTTDAMYERVVEWSQQINPATPVGLIHGKSATNEEWRKRTTPETPQVCDFDDGDDAYGLNAQTPTPAKLVGVPDEWLRGKHRTLLTPITVGTIDQYLMAAACIKFVSLRWAGLSGKVLIIDEVHSYSAYMDTFLTTLLQWCSDAAIPVLLMSATLTPALRAHLAAAYAGREVPPSELACEGYPVVTTVTADGRISQHSSPPNRQDSIVLIERKPLSTPYALDELATVVADLCQPQPEIAADGCILVVVNQVARAQFVHQYLKEHGLETLLIHGKLTTSERARRTKQALDLLGKNRTGKTGRPKQLVVVATQIAEQSFDIDADILVTDLSPVDLLLQRIGRVHRHDRPTADRPTRFRKPRCIVTGYAESGDDEPPGLLKYPYMRISMLQAAHLIGCCNNADELVQWALPSQIPENVAKGYREDLDQWCPEGWRETAEKATAEYFKELDVSRNDGKNWRLHSPRPLYKDHALHNLHPGVASDEVISVRDGEPTVEVALVRRSERGYTTLAGTPLGVSGERCVGNPALEALVLGDTIRLRQGEELAKDAECLPGWQNSTMLRQTLALTIGDDDWLLGTSGTSDGRHRYHDELGLTKMTTSPP